MYLPILYLSLLLIALQFQEALRQLLLSRTLQKALHQAFLPLLHLSFSRFICLFFFWPFCCSVGGCRWRLTRCSDTFEMFAGLDFCTCYHCKLFSALQHDSLLTKLPKENCFQHSSFCLSPLLSARPTSFCTSFLKKFSEMFSLLGGQLGGNALSALGHQPCISVLVYLERVRDFRSDAPRGFASLSDN